ncbi:MAG: hypothetical protein HYT72_02465 [Candidatus Aenigmarchaeota archaeon]|nr:hypothetical protein [Candidatus Aenigmarchaeota archaeon]
MFKPDVFVTFLAGGLLIIAVMALFSGFLQPTEEAVKKVTTKSLTFSTNFSISNLKESSVIELGKKELINGLLFGSNSLVYNLTPKPADATLSFDVVRTNVYAPLTIAANGKILESRRLGIGKYSFSLNVNNTLITIAPESSLWKIWAPALYELDNTRIYAGSFRNETKEFNFELDQMDNFQFGNIVVLLSTNEGRFFVELNGNVIYEDTAVSGKSVPINKTFLKRQNSLVLRADKNSRLAGDAIVSLTYTAEE